MAMVQVCMYIYTSSNASKSLQLNHLSLQNGASSPTTKQNSNFDKLTNQKCKLHLKDSQLQYATYILWKYMWERQSMLYSSNKTLLG